MKENNPNTDQETNPQEGASWGTWISSAATSAYSNVVGETKKPSEQTESTATVPTEQRKDDTSSNVGFGAVDKESKNALWRQLICMVGMDLVHLRFSLPIWMFEPTTALTRMVETFEYSDLLDRAAAINDPVLRDCLVAAFVISAFSHTERVQKPFNPVLGETFEFVHPANNMKFYAEQVSHHPPISMSSCQGKGWVAGECVDINATFQGNSIEIRNTGSRFIHFTDTEDHYTWNLPQAVVANMFVGNAFVDHFGTIELRNEKMNTTSILELKKCGWFWANRYEVTGEQLDEVGNQIVSFKGAWNKYLDCEELDKKDGRGANRLWMAGSHMLPEEEGGGENGHLAGCTKFTKRVLAFDSDYAAQLPPTDSRLRPDRQALARGDRGQAAERKLRIEQLQRARRSELKEKAPVEAHEPRYFKKVSEDEQKWEPIGNYWTDARNLSDEKRKSMTLW